MLEIAEFISPTPSPVWKLARQAGVDLAVGGLPFDDIGPGEQPWDLEPLRRMKQRYEEAGFALRVIESRPRSTLPSVACRDATKRSPRSARCSKT